MVMLTNTQIKALREFLELSRTDFASKLGVSASAVTTWETDAEYMRHPRWETVEKINAMLEEAEKKGFKVPREKVGAK